MSDETAGTPFVRVADIEIDSVAQASSGFVLTGRGQDRADYRLELTIELPMDPKTRAVVAELLSQSDMTLLRRARPPLRSNAAPRRNAPAG